MNINKQKNKIDLIDVAVIVLTIIIIAVLLTVVVGYFYNQGSLFDLFSKKEKEFITFTVKIEKIDISKYSIDVSDPSKPLIPFLNVGDTVWKDNKKIGSVKSVKIEEHKEKVDKVDSLGNAVYALYPGYVDLKIEIETDAVLSKEKYNIAGNNIIIGDSYFFCTSKCQFESIIIDVNNSKGGKA